MTVPIPETPLAIQLFGPFEVRVGGALLPRLRSRKGLWLLALLALRRGQAVERDWLAGLLWPESGQAQAFHSLRMTLTDLRRALGPAAGRLQSPTSHTLALDLADADVDLVAFDAAIRQGDEAALERAVGLYRGPLLEGCAEEWAFQERQAREQEYLTARERLAALALVKGTAAEAERHLRLAVALDPLRESAQRSLMQALAAGGNYAAATQVYRELRLRLHRELNTAPDPETQALYQQLRAEAREQVAGGTERSSLPTGPVVPSSGPTLSPSPYPEGTVTFLFSDIEGSSRLWEQHPAAMKSDLEQHDVLLRQTLQAHGGLVFKTVGDAFHAAFATAPGAIAAALAAQQALLTEAWEETGPLRVRMALHTGIVEAREGDYFGPTLNRVARLLDAGHGGQILLSLPTAELVRDSLPEGVGLRSLGEHRLKDLVRPEHVFQLLHPDLPAPFPPLRSLAAFTHNLPLQWTSFIGREQELEELKRLLPTTPLLTLTGLGGGGKTRLALQVAADLLDAYPDGVWLVELASLDEPALLAQTVAGALGVLEEAGRPMTATLIEHLRSRALLLVLDNCEHLIAACAALIDALLRACPNLRILATSRERLGLTGERVYRVPSLSLPPLVDGKDELAAAGPATFDDEPTALLQSEAVRLFVERAVNGQAQFVLTAQNAAAVAQLCHRLDGIPLALELAAARVMALSVEQINARIGEMFRLLTGRSRTTLPRQQTLRAVFDWSYDLLSEPEKILLGRLSVFAGGWTLEAAEAICASGGIEEWEVLDLLTQLVEKSLVMVEEWDSQARYRLLEPVRQYGRDRLMDSTEVEAMHERHRDFFLEWAEQAETRLRGSEQLVWRERLNQEHDNLRAALEWCRSTESGAEAGLRLATALSWFWVMRNYFREGRHWLEGALSRRSEAAPSLQARALVSAAELTSFDGDRASAEQLAQEGLQLARQTGEPWVAARALFLLGNEAIERRDLERATALEMESLATARALGDRWLAAFALHHLGLISRVQGDLEAATASLAESLDLLRQTGDRWSSNFVLLNLALVAAAQGDYVRATALSREAIALCREMSDRRGILWCLHGLAWAAAGEGQSGRAVQLLGAAEALGEDIRRCLPPAMRATSERTLEEMRAVLPEEAFAAAWAAGRCMSLGQVIGYVLGEQALEYGLPETGAGTLPQ